MTTIPTAATQLPKGLRAILAVIVAVAFTSDAGAIENTATPDRASSDPRSRATPVEIALAPPGDPSWKPLLFRSIDRPTRFDVRADPEGRPAFRATSDCGASALVLQLPEDFDLLKTPRLAWRWRIEKGIEVEAEKEQSEAGDDFAARLYVLHGFDAERASAWQRMEHRMGRTFFGAETPGETITYVWASQTEPGQSWTSPSREEAKLLVLESDSAATSSRAWREAIVDLSQDARRLFSPAPRKAPYAISLMSDADGVCQRAVAWFADFRLLGPAPPAPPSAEAEAGPETHISPNSTLPHSFRIRTTDVTSSIVVTY